MTKESKEYFREIEDCAAFSRVRAMLVTHPKKSGYARILCAYPKDGAGRLTVYIVDGFGDRFTTQKGTAGGYGYDKLTAALSSMTIDGHSLTDHCGQDETSAKLLKAYGKYYAAQDAAKAENVERAAKSAGYSLTNWETGGGWGSCYRLPGLEYLRALGYSIIDVI